MCMLMCKVRVLLRRWVLLLHRHIRSAWLRSLVHLSMGR